MKIIWQTNAKASFQQIARYIKRYFGIKAKRNFAEEVLLQSNLLLQFPNMGKIDPLFDDRTDTYRSIIINGLSKLVYRINGDVINVVAFWDCRCEPVAQAKKVK